MKIVVFTLGCKVNECESDSLICGLKERGYEVVDRLEPADLYIVNTCAITADAEKKSRQTSSRIKRIAPNAKIIYTGCAAEKDPEAFMGKPNAKLITGVFGKGRILDALDGDGLFIAEHTAEYEELPFPSSLKDRTYVKVQDGCNNFCSYCIVPYLRGRSRSRKISSVVKEVNNVATQEIVINGINLSSYDDDGKSLADLMDALAFTDKRIRLGSLEANIIDDKFLYALKNLKNFAPHFHLSLQSGSDNVLKKMNRRYTRAQFIEKVDLIRSVFPNAGITTDIIAGFPTETEEDFSDTLRLIERVRFSDVHPFIFSPRQGTVAYKMQDLPHEIKKERLDRLILAKERCKADFAKSNVNKTLSVIFEEEKDGYFEGYSENYLRIYIKADKKPTGVLKVIVDKPFKDGCLAHI